MRTPEPDVAGEQAIAARLEKAWSCRITRYGRWNPVDWWAERDGRPLAVGETKARAIASSDFPTVYLGFRKWLALTIAAVGAGVQAVYVVQFTDGIRWIDVRAIDARRLVIGGNGRHELPNDIEPLIVVPIADMHELAE